MIVLTKKKKNNKSIKHIYEQLEKNNQYMKEMN